VSVQYGIAFFSHCQSRMSRNSGGHGLVTQLGCFAPSQSPGHPENVIPRRRLLDNVMLYWLTASAASSARLYWESFRKPRLEPVEVPTGVTIFPHEMTRLPRYWLERRFTDLRHYSTPDTGGHFAALEQPETLVDELRTFFRMVR